MSTNEEVRSNDTTGASCSDDKGTKNDDDDDNNSIDSDTESINSMKQAPNQSLYTVLGLAKPEWPMLFIAVVFMICAETTMLINPILLAGAYDNLIDPTLNTAIRMMNINRIMTFVFIIHIAGFVCFFIRSSIMQMIGERVVARLRCTLYKNILQQEITFFDINKSGELISRLGSDTTLLQQGCSQSCIEVCIGIIKIVVALFIMFYISWKLALVMLGFVLCTMMVAVPFGMTLGTLSKQYQNLLGAAQGCSTEALQAMRTVQSFSAEHVEHQRYEQKIGNPANYRYWYPGRMNATNNTSTTYSVGFYKALFSAGFFTMIFGVGFLGLYVSLWYGFKLVNDGEMTLGSLTAFQSYIFTIGGALGSTSQEATKLIEALGISGRIFHLLYRTPRVAAPTMKYDPINTKTDDNNIGHASNGIEVSSSNGVIVSAKDKANTGASTAIVSTSNNNGNKVAFLDAEIPCTPLKPSTMKGSIDFNNVIFSYPSRPNVVVLNGFSLSVPANQTAALVGASGCGKSTCISLLQRFYDVSADTDNENFGSITIDGHDIRNLDLKWLRTHMAYVQQEPQLFGLSIRENILYGVPGGDKITDDEIMEVAKTANAHEFIIKWPKGYDTLVGERGVKLSGGQKQRIAIARALIRQPRILLLDEATSALDAESEHLVQEAIDNAIVGRTVIVVAHRLSTIQRAHQIVVIGDNHTIVDVGTHQELLQRCDKYQDLIKRQAIITSKNYG